MKSIYLASFTANHPNEVDEVDFYLIDLESRFNKIDKSKYFLAYSGGKDSHFLYWFIKNWLKDTEIKIVSSNTFMEHPQIKARMDKYADRILIPKMKPFEIKAKYGIPLASKLQDDFIERYQHGGRTQSLMERINGESGKFNLNKKFRELLLSGNLHKVTKNCCTELKKKPMKQYMKESGKLQILGVRSSEGVLRSVQYHSCFSKNGTFTPLWDLTDEMMDKIYEKYNIEIPDIYNYLERTGCMGCPYGRYTGTLETELALLPPNQLKFVIEYFKESYDILGVNYKNIQTILPLEFKK